MSLVNDMLNDLDARRSKQHSNEVELDWMAGQRKPQKNHYYLPLLSLFAVLMLVAVGYSVWHYSETADMGAVEKLSTVSASRDVAEPVVVAQEVEKSPVHKTYSPVPQQQKASEIEAEKQEPTRTEQLTKLSVSDPAGQSNIKPTAEETKVSSKTPAAVRKVRPLSFSQQDNQLATRAQSLIRQQRVAEAETELYAYIQQNPAAVHSGELLASLWLSQKRFEKTQGLLDMLRSQKPRHLGLLMIQARLYLVTASANKSVDLLMAERPEIDANQGYYELLGVAARQNKQYQLSAQAYRGLLEIDDSHGDWWVGLAIALEMQGQQSLAREAYRNGLETNNINASLRNYAAQRLEQR